MLFWGFSPLALSRGPDASPHIGEDTEAQDSHVGSSYQVFLSVSTSEILPREPDFVISLTSKPSSGGKETYPASPPISSAHLLPASRKEGVMVTHAATVLPPHSHFPLTSSLFDGAGGEVNSAAIPGSISLQPTQVVD
ncbi:hypothetical protein H1C71_018976 [Ictidomys tridecemlineatus]|nr:hypothetical protein H1C71_018976 [Ictidomys tridecemlineatus]